MCRRKTPPGCDLKWHKVGQPSPWGFIWGCSFQGCHPKSGRWERWVSGVEGSLLREERTSMKSAVSIQMANRCYPVLLQSDGRSLRGVLELSVFSSKLPVLVSILQAGQLSLSESVCCRFFLPWVFSTLSCSLHLKTESIRSHQKCLKIKCSVAFRWRS